MHGSPSCFKNSNTCCISAVRIVLWYRYQIFSIKWTARRNQIKSNKISMNRVSTLFTSIYLLKVYSVKITVFSGVFCKMFSWNMRSKSYKSFEQFQYCSFSYVLRILANSGMRHSKSTSLAKWSFWPPSPVPQCHA